MSAQHTRNTTEDTPAPRRICVVGLGYVGNAVADAFHEAGHDVSGYDVDVRKIARLASEDGHDGRPEGNGQDRRSITYSADPAVITPAEIILIAVPTPITNANEPNLTYLKQAADTVGRAMTRGATVILESTVFPGATRHVLTPALADASGFTPGEEFSVGYSPERIVPGRNDRRVEDAVKVVSAFDPDTLERLSDVYGQVTEAGVCPAPAVEVAEAAKCIENIQRDVNIALTNELAIACDAIGIDWREVLAVASTKWNFHDEYRPGLVGGHCIPVDPYFFLAESESNGFDPELIATAREVNDYVPTHVAKKLIKALNDAGKVLRECHVLVLGLTYKPNVTDIRTSAIDGTIQRLKEFDVAVSGYDPYSDDRALGREFDIEVRPDLTFDGYDAILVGAAHDAFDSIDFASAVDRMRPRPILFDVEDGLTASEEYPEELRVVRF